MNHAPRLTGPEPERPWRLGPAPVAALAVAGAWVLVRLYWRCAHKFFGIDEFLHAHRAWLATQGAGRVAELSGSPHSWAMPLFFAPFALLAGDDPAGMILLRFGGALVVTAIVVLTACLCSARASVAGGSRALAALLVLPSLAFATPFINHAMEIRPDGLAAAFLLGALAALEVRRWSDRRAAAVAGTCLLLAVLCSIKAAVYGTAFVIPFLADILLRPRRRDGDADGGRGRRALRAPVVLAATFGLGLSALVALLFVTGEYGRVWGGLLGVLQHQKHYPGFGAMRFARPYLLGAAPAVALAAGGAVVASRRVVDVWRAERRLARDAVHLLLLVSTWASFAIQTAPYQYSMIPAALMTTVFAVRAMVELSRSVQPWGSRGAATVTLIVTTLALASAADANVRLALQRRNDRQIEVQAMIGALSAPGDPVFDMSAAYAFRPSAYKYPLIARLRATIFREQILREVPAALERTATMLFVYDDRYRWSWKKTSLGKYLRRHYQRYNDDIFVRGRRWGPGEHGKEQSFEALRGGDYFFWPPAAPRDGELLVDGASQGSNQVVLGEGPHRVEWRPRGKSPGDLYLIWRPPSGETWDPTRESPKHSLGRIGGK